jgi:hypothetical protein
MFNPINLESILDYAHSYLDNGFSIIPLQKKSKKPSIDKWDPFQVSHPSKEQLEEWFSNVDNNIGIITGRISAIFVIDIDGKKAYEYYINKIQSQPDRQLITANENTMKIKTGSGNTNIVFGFNPQEFTQHELRNLVLWKESDDNNGEKKVDEQANNNNNHSEIRLKGEGGYIVAPPSIHPNNNEYTLINGIEPISLKRERIQKLIKLFSKDVFNSDKKSTKDISQIVQILKSHYSNGFRNDLVLYLSGWLRKLGILLEDAEEIIIELAKDDEEKHNRIRTLHETYKKEDLDEIAGYSGLLKLLSYKMMQKTS